MRSSFVSASLVLAVSLSMCAVNAQAPAPPAPPRAMRLADAPPEIQPQVQKAIRDFEEFQTELVRRMNEELTRGGPAAAFSVYRDEAATLTAQIARRDHIRIGRTSYRLRNPHNSPPQWAMPYVTESAARSFKQAPTWVVDLDFMVGVLAPIETKDVCLLCHGPADKLRPAIQGAIRAAYPGDRATGFEPGQVRGWMWAEVQKRW